MVKVVSYPKMNSDGPRSTILAEDIQSRSEIYTCSDKASRLCT